MIVTRTAKSFILIAVQISCLVYLALSGNLLPENTVLRILMAIAGLLVLWAALIMNKKFNIAPDVIEGAKLIRSGPYKLIRHPMYLSVFLIMLCWIIDYFTYIRLLVIIMLFIVMILKIYYEESLLKKAFPEYKEYQSQTKKIIPFVY